jgi:hypothetical protein
LFTLDGGPLQTSAPESTTNKSCCSRFYLIVLRLFCFESRESLRTVNSRKIKTTSPLSYLLQAAMGQCSTLPEARNSSAARHDGSGQVHRDNSSRQRLKEEGRTESLDFNKLTTVSNENTKVVDQRKLHVTVPVNGEHEFARFPQMDNGQPQARDPDGQSDGGMVEPMDIDQRDVSYPVTLPPPPEHATRARCYKLNLDSEMVGLTGNSKPHTSLGPFYEPLPPLTYSSSDDSGSSCSATNVAIQTAQIFRGITISKDGTILSQNARATRSNRGNKTKRGEKSRQAAKIDKAKDLVEEAVLTGKVSQIASVPCVQMCCSSLTVLPSLRYSLRMRNRTSQPTWYRWLSSGHMMT